MRFLSKETVTEVPLNKLQAYERLRLLMIVTFLNIDILALVVYFMIFRPTFNSSTVCLQLCFYKDMAITLHLIVFPVLSWIMDYFWTFLFTFHQEHHKVRLLHIFIHSFSAAAYIICGF